MKFSDLSPKFQKEAISTIKRWAEEYVDDAIKEYKSEHGVLPEWAATEELREKECEDVFESYFSDIKDDEGYFSIYINEDGRKTLECG